MPTIILFNPSTGAITGKLDSRDENEFAGRADALIDPVIPDAPLHFCKVDGGSIREWTQAEKDAQAQADAAAQAQAQLEQTWQEKLAGTWTDPVTGLTFDTSIESRNTIIGQSSMLREAVELGILTNDSSVPVWPVGASDPTLLTVSQARALWLRFGLAWQDMYNEFCP